MKTRSILLVEDNPDDEELTLLAFNQSQVLNRVDVVRDGEEALEYLFCEGRFTRREPEPPGLVLLDLKLPKIDGLEVLRLVREDSRTRLQPVVVLTSSREEVDLVKSYSFGANSYIQKPVDFRQFSVTIQTLGRYWLTINEAPSWQPA
jgi:two-component system response regulator